MARNNDIENPKITREKRAKRPIEGIAKGYSSLAAFSNWKPDFAIYRKFGAVRSRLLLCLQIEIQNLEDELQDIDDDEYRVYCEQQRNGLHPLPPGNHSWLKDRDESRQKKIASLRMKLKEYDDELFRLHKVLALPAVEKPQVENYNAWLDHNSPIDLYEMTFLDDHSDLVALGPQEDESVGIPPWMRKYVRKVPGFHLFNKLFRKKKREGQLMENDENAVEYSKNWKNTFMRILFAIIITGIITAGVIALYFVRKDKSRLVILVMATFLCALILSTLTTAKKGEIMAATAAYAAVLVVFVGSTLDGHGLVNVENRNTTMI